MSAALADILGPNFRDAFKRATALPGEAHWDDDLCIPCEIPPSDRVAWCDPIPDMEPAR